VCWSIIRLPDLLTTWTTSYALTLWLKEVQDLRKLSVDRNGSCQLKLFEFELRYDLTDKILLPRHPANV